MSTKGKWLGWEPKAPDWPDEAQIFLKNASSEPTETTKTAAEGVSVVFVGPPLGQILNIETVPCQAKTTPAPGVLGCAGAPSSAVEVWSESAGGQVFIVADDQDAKAAVERLGASPGEIWTGAEIELVARISDPAIRAEVAAFKRRFGGRLAPSVSGIPFAQWKAEALNQLFRELRGRPGRISASTVRDGERKSDLRKERETE